MTDPNDKWSWGDESDPAPGGAPLFERKVEPLFDWFDEKPAPPSAGLSTPAPPSEPEPAVREAPAPASEAASTPKAPALAPEAAVEPRPAPARDPVVADLIEWPEPEIAAAPPKPAAPEIVVAPPSPAPASPSVRVPAPEPAPQPAPVASHDLSSSVVKATVLHLEGQLNEAIAELKAGLGRGEPQVEIYAAMGSLQMELGRYEDAAQSFLEVFKRDPQNETAQHNHKLCDQKVKDSKKPPKAPQALVKAIMLHMEGKLEEAMRELQRGIKAGETSADVYAALGHLQFETDRFDAAAETYARVVEIEPNHKTCHYNLAVSLEKTGRHRDALASFSRAYEINPARIEFAIGVGVSLLRLKRYGEALEAFEDCLESHPDEFHALFGKAYALQCLKRNAEAEAAYLAALERNQGGEEILSNLIALMAAQGGTKDSDERLRQYATKLLELRPDSKAALETLMAAELAAKNYEAACGLGERLTRVAADSFEAWFNFGLACRGAGWREHTAAAFAKAARIRPKSFEAQVNLGDALREQGDLAGARSAFEAALKLSPDQPAVVWSLIAAAEQSGDWREAERLCAALAKSAKSEAAWFRLGELRFERGDYQGSAEAYRSCLAARPDWPAAQLNLGLALWRAGHRNEARQKLEAVNGASAAEALHALASIAIEREEYAQALGYYKKLAESGACTAEACYNAGLITQNLGRLEEAAQFYRDALAAQPDMMEAIQALAQVVKGPARVEEIRKTPRKEPTLITRMLKTR